jgi:hypothetical protein
MLNPIPGGPGYLSLLGTSFLTCTAWEALTGFKVPHAQLLRSLDYLFTFIENKYVYSNASSYARFYYTLLKPLFNLHFLIYVLSFVAKRTVHSALVKDT